uniref:Uncharacterized protein n=1 Tax=Oryza brachyantha TaxID=4533 RepID=J3MER3_ORYBR
FVRCYLITINRVKTWVCDRLLLHIPTKIGRINVYNSRVARLAYGSSKSKNKNMYRFFCCRSAICSTGRTREATPAAPAPA